MTRAYPPSSDLRAEDDLLRELVEHPVPALPVAEASALRERVTGRIELLRQEIVDARVRAAKRRPWLVFAVAACSPLLIFAAMAGFGRGARHAGVATITDLRGRAVIAGDEVSTGPGDSVRAGLPTGATVEVDPSSRARFEVVSVAEGRGDRIALATGRLAVSVPKLGTGRDLRVQTAQAIVVVHGTRFIVEAAPGATRVTVIDGVVEVDSPGQVRMLTEGMSLAVADAAAGSAAPSEPPPAASPQPAPQTTDPGAGAKAGASTLASENALLADAMRLRREQRSDRAVVKLDELLSRHPGSPLAEVARVERLHALADTGERSRLVREAESYLADYPQGLARAEVERMLEAARRNSP
jgi:ferric-dicitrate binding protein FerR (iron transport regulator)